MATLPERPTGHELEEFVAAAFQCSRFFVDKNVEDHYRSTPTLELDCVVTSPRRDGAEPIIVEVKSGQWGFADLFKLYGWMNYLKVSKALLFATTRAPEESKHDAHCFLARELGITVAHCPNDKLPDAAAALHEAGFELQAGSRLHGLWRFAYWVERRYLDHIRVAARDNVPLGRAAKAYHQLINDRVFFMRDARERALALYNAYFEAPHLAGDAAAAAAGHADSRSILDQALRGPAYPFVQAAMYLQHRGRLAVLKAVVDRIISGGAEPNKPLRNLPLRDLVIPTSFHLARSTFEKQKYFYLYPLFWQVFTWTWGGFIILSRRTEEYERLSAETGIPESEIDNALSAFEVLFGESFRRTVILSDLVITKLLPASLRGLGSFNRLTANGLERYDQLDLDLWPRGAIVRWHNATSQLIETQPR